jgi:EcsC protein family
MPNLPELSARAGELVLVAVDKAVEARWEPARRNAAATTGTTAERVAQLRRTFARELATVGAATGGIAALPAAGTGTALATGVAEIGWFTARSADLILAIAAVHGHTEPSVEERRLWLLSVLAFGDEAATMVTRLAGEMGKGLGKKATAGISKETLRSINRAVGRTIVTKYGKKRGVIALGTALPFGIGAAIGGGANYALTRGIARNADSFFRALPQAIIDVDLPEGPATAPSNP